MLNTITIKRRSRGHNLHVSLFRTNYKKITIKTKKRPSNYNYNINLTKKLRKKDPIDIFEQVKKTFKSAKVNQTKASELFAAKKSNDEHNKENKSQISLKSKQTELDKRKSLKPNES